MQQHPLSVSTGALLYTNLIGSGSLARAIFITERLPSLSEKNSLWRKKEWGRGETNCARAIKIREKGGEGRETTTTAAVAEEQVRSGWGAD